MSLKQKLLDDLEAERTARIAAIEAATARIEEAEALATKLIAAGLPCVALGFSSKRYGSSGALKGCASADVYTDENPAPATILGAILQSGLTIKTIVPYSTRHTGITVRFADSDVTLNDISASVADMLDILPPDPNAAPPAPAPEPLRMVVNNVIGIAGTITSNQADEVPA